MLTFIWLPLSRPDGPRAVASGGRQPLACPLRAVEQQGRHHDAVDGLVAAGTGRGGLARVAVAADGGLGGSGGLFAAGEGGRVVAGGGGSRGSRRPGRPAPSRPAGRRGASRGSSRSRPA